MSQTWPWAAGSATGVGSLPGTDPTEAVKVVLGEFPDLPHLPELPERGPGADLIGRTAALLVDLPVELYAGAWRIAARPGVDRRRAVDLLERDLDTLTETAAGYSGAMKVQVGGVWTLAAGLELAMGRRVLRDHGACRDLGESLAEGIRAHVTDLRRRLPQATLLVQVDEPSLPAVLAGAVRTESGLYTYPAVADPRATEALRSLVEAAEVPVILHCCAPDPPLRLFAEAGASAVSIDLTVADTAATAGLDALGEVIDAGLALFAGVVSTRPDGGTAAGAADAVTRVWRRLGFPPERAASQVVVTPTCGLAGADPQDARRAMAAAAEAGRRVAEAG